MNQDPINNLSLRNPIPTDEDIERAILRIQERLSDKRINMAKNYAVKEGYTRAINNLKNRENNIDGLKTTQGRAIAAIAYDYLIGLCSENVLCNVPIKTR